MLDIPGEILAEAPFPLGDEPLPLARPGLFVPAMPTAVAGPTDLRSLAVPESRPSLRASLKKRFYFPSDGDETPTAHFRSVLAAFVVWASTCGPSCSPTSPPL
jgi:hypothetical protein